MPKRTNFSKFLPDGLELPLPRFDLRRNSLNLTLVKRARPLQALGLRPQRFAICGQNSALLELRAAPWSVACLLNEFRREIDISLWPSSSACNLARRASRWFTFFTSVACSLRAAIASRSNLISPDR